MILNVCIVNYEKLKQTSKNRYWARLFPRETADGITEAWEEIVKTEPTEEQWKELEQKAVAKEKRLAIARINAYFGSKDVKSFLVNKEPYWWDDSKRSTLRNMIESRHSAGDESVELWFGERKSITTYDDAIALLNDLECYASRIYNQRQSHIASVESLTDIWEIHEYDELDGYPEKVKIDI